MVQNPDEGKIVVARLKCDHRTMVQNPDEGKIVVALAFGFGLIGVARFMISPMFPVIAAELDLGKGDIGSITGALAPSWGTAALSCGILYDRVGRKRVLLGSLVMIALVFGASALATGVTSLVLVRVVLGFAGGLFGPASIAAMMEASSPENVGRNTGIQQMMLPLCGLGISPLIVVALLRVMSWRWVFAVFVIPAIWAVWLTARISPDAQAGARIENNGVFTDFQLVLSYRNVWIAMVGILCWLACLITTSAFMPSYLEDYLLLTEEQMETVMSAIGFGAAAGKLILSWLSDRFGRKYVVVISAAGACIMLCVLKCSVASTLSLFASLFMVYFFNNAALALTVGPIVAETVPPAMIVSASAIVIAVGELLGAGLAPMFVGQFVDHFGIVHLLWLPIASTFLGFIVSLLLEGKHGMAASCGKQDDSSTDWGDADSTTEDSVSIEEDMPLASVAWGKRPNSAVSIA